MTLQELYRCLRFYNEVVLHALTPSFSSDWNSKELLYELYLATFVHAAERHFHSFFQNSVVVAFLVLHQMIRAHEATSTNGAGKLLLASVHAAMTRQFIRSSKSFFATGHGALIGSLTCAYIFIRFRSELDSKRSGLPV